MSCNQVPALECPGGCAGWGCYCEATTNNATFAAPFDYYCSCQPADSLIAAIIYACVAVITLLICVVKWRAWKTPASVTSCHPNLNAKFWATALCITFTLCAIVCMSVGVSGLALASNTTGYTLNTTCSLSRGSLTAAYSYMMIAFLLITVIVWGCGFQFACMRSVSRSTSRSRLANGTAINDDEQQSLIPQG